MYPAGPRDDWWGKIPEADGGMRAAPDPGLRRWRSGVGAGLSQRVDTLSSLSQADAQREMMHGAAKDGEGAVVERLKRRYVAVPPNQHFRCAGQVVGRRQCCV
jgi:hypothetical protein